MTQRLFFPIALIISAGPLTFQAAGSANLEQEYQQVRTIALRDAKVRAAYEDADRRLETKIVQIDPALASYAATRAHGGGVPEQKATPAHATPALKPAAVTKGGFVAPGAAHGATHTVAKGETLGGIAAQYGVSVTALKAANHIQDERKLPVGQVLTIPGAKKAVPVKSTPEKKEKSWWDRLSS